MEEEGVAAAALAAIALQSATLKALVINGNLTAQQGTDTIDDALLMVEDSQAQSPELQKMSIKEDDRAGFPHNAKTRAEAAMTFHNDHSLFT